jgi:hypothetical protein
MSRWLREDSVEGVDLGLIICSFISLEVEPPKVCLNCQAMMSFKH